jgi:hypothetical protein
MRVDDRRTFGVIAHWTRLAALFRGVAIALESKTPALHPKAIAPRLIDKSLSEGLILGGNFSERFAGKAQPKRQGAKANYRP